MFWGPSGASSNSGGSTPVSSSLVLMYVHHISSPSVSSKARNVVDFLYKTRFFRSRGGFGSGVFDVKMARDWDVTYIIIIYIYSILLHRVHSSLCHSAE